MVNKLNVENQIRAWNDPERLSVCFVRRSQRTLYDLFIFFLNQGFRPGIISESEYMYLTEAGQT